MSADPPYLSLLKGEYGIQNWGIYKNYKAKYINTGSFRPVVHIIAFVMTLGYIMEYPHLKRARLPLCLSLLSMRLPAWSLLAGPRLRRRPDAAGRGALPAPAVRTAPCSPSRVRTPHLTPARRGPLAAHNR